MKRCTLPKQLHCLISEFVGEAAGWSVIRSIPLRVGLELGVDIPMQEEWKTAIRIPCEDTFTRLSVENILGGQSEGACQEWNQSLQCCSDSRQHLDLCVCWCIDRPSGLACPGAAQEECSVKIAGSHICSPSSWMASSVLHL